MEPHGRRPRLALPPEVIDYLHHGLIMFVGTCDANMRPESTLASAVRVSQDGQRLTVFGPEVLMADTLANLRANPQLALTVTRVTDDRSMQIKGVVVAHRSGDAADEAFLEPILIRRCEAMAAIGMPRSYASRLAALPTVAIDMDVLELFEQTPGPRAGEPMSSRGASS